MNDTHATEAPEMAKTSDVVALLTHYSNLKFAIMTVFVAATSGLFFARYGMNLVSNTFWLGLFCAASGLAVTWVFSRFDSALEDAMHSLRCEIKARHGSLLGDTPEEREGPVHRASVLLFRLAYAFWSLVFMMTLIEFTLRLFTNP